MSFSGTKGYITKPKPGVMLNPLHPLSQGLVGYWLFNEGSGSRAYDISGYGNHGTLTNMSPNAQNSGWGGSKFGGGLEFDGSNDYVDCGNFDLSGGFTAILWVKFGDNTTDLGILGQGTTGDDKIFKVWRDNFAGGDRIGFIVWNAANGIGTIGYGATTLDIKSYYMIAIIYNGAVGNIYLNGEDDTSIQQSNTIKSGTPPLRIGTYENVGGYHNGSIDFTCIYDRVLLPAEIKQLYHNPFCNLMQVPIRRHSVAAPPVGAIMNQFQRANIGADLYNGAILS